MSFTIGVLAAISLLGHEPPPEPVIHENRDISRRHYDDFRRTIQENFERWGVDRRRHIDIRLVERLAVNREVRGEAAAAVAAMRYVLRRKGAETTIDYDTLMNLGEDHRPTGVDRSLVDRYTYSLNIINKTNRELFGPGAPSTQGIRQGRLSDCFIIGPTGSLAARRPEAIRHLIRQESDGSYMVNFPGRPLHMPPLTDVEIALTAVTGEQGVWMKVIENALAMERNPQHPEGRKAEADLPEDKLSSGGTNSFTIGHLTGHASKYITIKPGDAKSHEEVRHLLGSSPGKMMAASTDKGKKPPHIANDHAYGVIKFENDKVHVWNPWGNKFEPKGPPGLDNGYPTESGLFVVPFHEFVQIFDSFDVETDKPLEHSEHHHKRK